MDALGDRPTVFRFEREGLEDQEIKSALDKIGWLCHMPRLPTIVDDQSVVVQWCRLAWYGVRRLVAAVDLITTLINENWGINHDPALTKSKAATSRRTPY